MGRDRRIITSSAQDTILVGENIGKTLLPNSVICLFGDLAAGKTTLVKGLAKGFADVTYENVNSPTFSLLNIYGTNSFVYHFDLYRLSDADEFLALGFEDYFFAGGVCCVEWSEKIAPLVPHDAVTIELLHRQQGQREIIICGLKN